VGEVIPGVEVRISPDNEILVRGPNVFQGYWQRPDATAAVMLDGWYRTGDDGVLDAEAS
jgi:long-chain acyl-CoA synthetase